MAPGPPQPANMDALAALAPDIATNASQERCVATAIHHKFAAALQQASTGTMYKPALSAVLVQGTATPVQKEQNVATTATHKFVTLAATEAPSGTPSGPATLEMDVISNPTRQSATASTKPSDERTTKKATRSVTRTEDRVMSKHVAL